MRVKTKNRLDLALSEFKFPDDQITSEMKTRVILDLKDLYKCSGVWALIAQRKDSEENPKQWECLQVAKSVNIGLEICEDAEFLKEENFTCASGDLSYINWFGQEVYTYAATVDKREIRRVTYTHMKESYINFRFILIKKEMEDDKKRQLERLFAFKSNAKYWRNGRAFNRPPKERKTNYKGRERDEQEFGVLVNEVLDIFQVKY